MKINFGFRLALFAALGFLLTTVGTTIVDEGQTSHVNPAFRLRHYPIRPWVWFVCAAGICLVTWLAVGLLRSWRAKFVSPSLVLVLAGICTLPAFRPEMPHGGIVFWLFFYALTSLFGSWIHFAPFDDSWLLSPAIARDMKIERLKEHITLWRTVAVSLTFGYLALLIPWLNLTWNVSSHIVTKEDEIFKLSQFATAEIFLLSLFVLSCVIAEAFTRAKGAGDLLLKIPKKRDEDQSNEKR